MKCEGEIRLCPGDDEPISTEEYRQLRHRKFRKDTFGNKSKFKSSVQVLGSGIGIFSS